MWEGAYVILSVQRYGGIWPYTIKTLRVPGHMVVSFPAYVPVSTKKHFGISLKGGYVSASSFN